MKLHGQIECTSCHRFYFPAENSDDENDDDEQTQKIKQLCCDCEAKQADKSPPRKRRASQRQNGVQPSPLMIKQEKIDSNESPGHNNGCHGQITPLTNRNGFNHLDLNRMVQIHSVDLLAQPMVPLNNINSEY